MKLALAATLLLSVPSAFGFKKTAVLGRRLQDGNQNNQGDDAAEEDEFQFLQNYEQVYMTCDPNKMVYNQEDGNYEVGAVVYRLCPSGTACDDNERACASGYGDYVVGLQTYMEGFMNQFKREQEEYNQYNGGNNQDEEFNMEEFGQCGKFEVQANDDQNNQQEFDENGNELSYFIGPLCTEGGDIRLALFYGPDNGEDGETACQPDYETAEGTFYELTGFNLPWSSSIMDDQKCKAYYCSAVNDNGEYEINEFCQQLFENSQMKCEEQMEYYSPYGQMVADCEEVEAMIPSYGSGNGAGWFVFLLLVACVVGFGVWYFMQQKKKSAVNQEGLMM